MPKAYRKLYLTQLRTVINQIERSQFLQAKININFYYTIVKTKQINALSPYLSIRLSFTCGKQINLHSQEVVKSLLNWTSTPLGTQL